MLLNLEKSGEQNKEFFQEWLVNTDPGFYVSAVQVF